MGNRGTDNSKIVNHDRGKLNSHIRRKEIHCSSYQAKFLTVLKGNLNCQHFSPNKNIFLIF